MNFQTYLDKAWDDHVSDSEAVELSFTRGLELIESNEELVQLCGLMTHVMGEHLGSWDRGIDWLEQLAKHPKFQSSTETEFSILRSKAVMRIGKNKSIKLDEFSRSDQIRILAVASSALSAHDLSQSKKCFTQAISLAAGGLEKSDPANRSLAVTGNNLACALEEKAHRTPEEIELMILAAQTGRKYWEIAGTWSDVAMAENRLAQTFSKAGDADKALEHAQKCLQIRTENQV